jgi:hypothetical protein
MNIEAFTNHIKIPCSFIVNCEYFLPDQSITFKLIFKYKEEIQKGMTVSVYSWIPADVYSLDFCFGKNDMGKK